MGSGLLALIAAIAVVATLTVNAQPSTYEIDLSQPTTPFPRTYPAARRSAFRTNATRIIDFWARCVGSGHASLALRADWRAALTQSQSALGWQYIRFHGILDDDMSIFCLFSLSIVVQRSFSGFFCVLHV
jgi:hypothetical protein